MDSIPEESGLDDSDSLLISEPPCSGAGSESSSSCNVKVENYYRCYVLDFTARLLVI